MDDALTTTAHDLFFPVVVCNDRRTLCCSITHCIMETNVVKQLLYLPVQGTANDELIEVAAKCLCQAVADLFLNAVTNDRNLHEHPHAWVLYARHHSFSNYFLNDERHNNKDDRFHFR